MAITPVKTIVRRAKAATETIAMDHAVAAAAVVSVQKANARAVTKRAKAAVAAKAANRVSSLVNPANRVRRRVKHVSRASSVNLANHVASVSRATTAILAAVKAFPTVRSPLSFVAAAVAVAASN
jgi:hypothetical protein